MIRHGIELTRRGKNCHELADHLDQFIDFVFEQTQVAILYEDIKLRTIIDGNEKALVMEYGND
jgi:hypothetical protein